MYIMAHDGLRPQSPGMPTRSARRSAQLGLLLLLLAHVTHGDAKDKDAVREQYEELPYPSRDPDDEVRRLLPAPLAHPFLINRVAFAGAADRAVPGATGTVRVLVAGGGTGDATVFLAQKCTDLNVSGVDIVHLDISAASIAVAKARLHARQVGSRIAVRFVHGSLLDLPTLLAGEQFDYINCVGVLHHLADPLAGLLALNSVLADGGAIGIMLYAPHGRRGIYSTQRMLQLLSQSGGDTLATIPQKLALARAQWHALSDEHPAKRNPSLRHLADADDAELFDFLLHAQDRPFSVLEIDQLLRGAGLRLLSFLAPAPLRARSHTSDPVVLKAYDKMDWLSKMAYGELLSGQISRHDVFAVKQSLRLSDLEKRMPCPREGLLDSIGRNATLCPLVELPDLGFDWRQAPLQTMSLRRVVSGFTIDFAISGVLVDILRQSDCVQTLEQIYVRLRAPQVVGPNEWESLLEAVNQGLVLVKDLNVVLVR